MLSRLFGAAEFVKCRWLLLELNSYGLYSGSERKRRIRRRMFTFSIKRRIRRFHFIVVQSTSKKCTKKLDARAATVVFMLKPIVFWRRGGSDFCIFTFTFFCTNSRGCYKNYKYITKTKRRKPANYVSPDQRWNVRSGQMSLGFRVGHLSSLV